MTKPLITFFVAAFNQERFVREAVRAALAQTYSPMEVILSDDCSCDGTFEVMQKAAAEYEGPQRVVLNRNSKQLGLGGHLNKLVALSQGELIVCAAGDDVSLPDRTWALYEAWQTSGRRATSVHSDYIQIDENGKEIEKVFPRQGAGRTQQGWNIVRFVKTLQPTVFGCTHAFSRRLFETFGDVPDALVHEDDVLALRSMLAGAICYVDRPLLKYRVHSHNVYVRGRQRIYRMDQLAREEASVCRFFFNRRTMYDTFTKDLKTAWECDLIEKPEFEQALTEAERLSRRSSLTVEYLDSRLFDRYGRLKKLRNENLEPGEYAFLAKRLVPRALLLRSRLARNYAARAFGL